MEAANDADVICILVPDDVIALLAARAARRLVRDRRERLHARLRPTGPARRQRDGRAADARSRSAPLLRGRRRVHHRGRRAPRRDRARARPRARDRQGDRRSAPGWARAHADAGSGARSRRRAGALTRAHRREQRVRADDDGARHPDRGDRRRARALGRGRAHLPAAARGRATRCSPSSTRRRASTASSRAAAATTTSTSRRRCAASPTTSSRAGSPTSGTPNATPATRRSRG